MRPLGAFSSCIPNKPLVGLRMSARGKVRSFFVHQMGVCGAHFVRIGLGRVVQRLIVPLRVGILDIDLLDHGTRHPNLALMKISAFLKEEGHDVSLIQEAREVQRVEDCPYEKVVASKVFNFSATPPLVESIGVPGDERDVECYARVNNTTRVVYGGTGFTYEGQAYPPNLPAVIEHHKPDYSLYNEYVNSQILQGKKRGTFKDYLDYSIGFTTRGCFRKCRFCVNQHYNEVRQHSPVSEFLDDKRPYIYLWDDNFLGLGIRTRARDERLHRVQPWEQILDQLDATRKPFQFRQGLDMRLMTPYIAERLSHSHYHGDYIFAFDHIQDAEIISRNIRIWQEYNHKVAKFYVLCGFDGIDEVDVANTLERIRILMEHGAIPYIMRHENYKRSRYRGLYVQLARWCNQPQFFKKKSFREYCEACQEYHVEHSAQRTHEICAALNELRLFAVDHPEIARQYFDIRFDRQGL